jgi:hypothetical protein
MQGMLAIATDELTTTLIITAAAVACAIAAFAITRRHRRLHDHRGDELPPLVFTVRDRHLVRDLRPAGLRDRTRDAGEPTPRSESERPAPPDQPAPGAPPRHSR